MKCNLQSQAKNVIFIDIIIIGANSVDKFGQSCLSQNICYSCLHFAGQTDYNSAWHLRNLAAGQTFLKRSEDAVVCLEFEIHITT